MLPFIVLSYGLLINFQLVMNVDVIKKNSDSKYTSVVCYYFFINLFLNRLLTNSFYIDLVLAFLIPVIVNSMFTFNRISIKKGNKFVWIYLLYTTFSFATVLFRQGNTILFHDLSALMALIGIAIVILCCVLEMNFYVKTKTEKEINIIVPLLFLALVNLVLSFN